MQDYFDFLNHKRKTNKQISLIGLGAFHADYPWSCARIKVVQKYYSWHAVSLKYQKHIEYHTAANMHVLRSANE